jgi:hypothetical protein
MLMYGLLNALYGYGARNLKFFSSSVPRKRYVGWLLIFRISHDVLFKSIFIKFCKDKNQQVSPPEVWDPKTILSSFTNPVRCPTSTDSRGRRGSNREI